jgi:hypothetical protein
MSPTTPPPSLETLANNYISLATALHELIGEMSGVHCADCEDPCCSPEHCSSLEPSAWLRFVAERAGATIPDALPYNFLGPTGCTLPVGRPIQCTAYLCDQLALAIRDPLDRFTYQIASDALPHVARQLTRTLDLTDVEDLDALTDAQRHRMAKRIGEAHDCLKRVIALRSNRDGAARVEETATELLRIASIFPYAARQVRFDGQLPSLSQATRKKLADQASA